MRNSIMARSVLYTAIAAFPAFTMGEGEGDTSFTQEQLDTAIAAAVVKANEESGTASEGLKTKNAELLKDLRASKAAGKRFEGVDLEALLALQTTVENDEILSLMAAGKHSEAIDAATERMKVTHTAEMDTVSTQLKELQESGAKNIELIDSLLIDGGSKAAFLEAKGLPTASEDIALRARQVWKVQDGILTAVDGEGKMIQGEKGPLTMKEWSEGLKKTAPHLFPASETGGAGGGEGGEGGSVGNLDSQILAAAAKGDFGLQRELNAKKKKLQRGR